jgi:hypothetical protein
MATQRNLVCLRLKNAAASYIPLRWLLRRLKPSISTPVLQYGSALSYDILAKILDVDTPLFLFDTEFYFQFSSL